MDPEVVVLKTKDELTKALAERVVTICNENKDDIFLVALSGGSLPKLLASGIVEKKDEIDFSKWRVFFADERYVSLDHEDSNYKASKSSFLDKVGIQSSQVFAIDHDFSLEEAASDYIEKLSKVTKDHPAKFANHLPRFDLILLGVGPDGHTCSLFPGHELLNASSRVVEFIKDSPKPPPERITLTFPVLNNALNVFFVTAGAEKQDILPQVVISSKQLKEIGPEALPAARVRPSDGTLVWFVDEAAAGKL